MEMYEKDIKIYEKGMNMGANDTNRYKSTWTYFKRQFSKETV
jgi:hypothetical protein